jgi:transcriptional regulator with AAA-type ATPase domain
MAPPKPPHNSDSFSGFRTEPAASTSRLGLVTNDVVVRWVFPHVAFSRFDRNPKVLERDKGCDTVLLGREVSRRHASIQIEGVCNVIRDLGSRNGVYVNGKQVDSCTVNDQDVIRIGDCLGVVDAEGTSVNPAFRSITAGWYGGDKLHRVLGPAHRIAASDLAVVIQGETGTGKEGVARAIHEWSGRTGPFVGVNCATITPELAEAALFGHRKGAFTGADRAAVGYFRAAHRGTLLLDEVVELPAAVQAKLLRALEEREVVPVGDTEPTAVDVRVLTAAQESLDVAVADHRFRADLYARLDGLTLTLPPLRQRREDIVPLFRALLRDRCAGTPPELEYKLVDQLLSYDWPLNVRELVQLTRQLLALHATEPVLKRSFLPSRMQPRQDTRLSEPAKPARANTKDEVAFDEFVAALRVHSGNVARAAASIGITRARAYRLLDARPDFDIDALRPGDSSQ